jgi:GH24 family phage-related lysozyme (muramidase)
MKVSFYDTVVKDLRKWEGVISHMYLDTRGYVTVGVGFMIPSAAAAKGYGFVSRATKKKATDKEKADEWDNIKKQKKAMRAAYYKTFTRLDLPDSEIDSALTKKAKSFEKQIKTLYKDYDTYPDEAKLALIDLAYNLGFGGLKKYQNMKKAIDAGKWDDAAKHSNRPDGRASRNKYVSDLLKAAGKKAASKAGKTP